MPDALAQSRKLEARFEPEPMVRTYVLNPAPRVLDPRTGLETTDAEAVLNGHIDDFLRAALDRRRVLADDRICKLD